MKKASCPTNLIIDTAQSEDLFEGKPHERLAEAIADVIRNEHGGKTIGLEGGWGAGKSTIIRLLANKLDQKNNQFLIFDAWAHEGDPLRRTFLESLIYKLIKSKWIKKEDGELELKALSGRFKISTQKTTPKIDRLGLIIIVFIAVFTPLALAFLSGSMDHNLLFPWDKNAGNIDPYFSVFLLYSIAIVSAAIYLWRNRKDAHTLAIVFRQIITDINTETYETPNPTSVEFERLFCMVITQALLNNNRRFIIVLDNLDRVSPVEAVNMLSTLQTFLQHGQQNNQQFMSTENKLALDKLWVIIPYDRIGIEQVWENKENLVASHMLDKRFQIRFQVPPMVLSNWKSYLIYLVKQAFPNHAQEEDLEHIYQIIQLTLEKHPRKSDDTKSSKAELGPTPRNLINIINQMGSLHRQWCNEGIPITDIAFYASYRFLHPEKNISELLLNDDNFPDSQIMEWLHEQVLDNLAALWYNVEVNIASQLLYKENIFNCLINGDYEKLQSIKGKTSGVWPIISSLLPRIKYNSYAPIYYANIIYALEKSGVMEDVNKTNEEYLREFVTDGLVKSGLDDVISKDDGEIYLTALMFSPTPKLANAYIKKLNNDLNTEGADGQLVSKYTQDNIEGWVETFLILIPELEKIDPKLKESPVIIIPGDQNTFVSAAALISEIDTDGKYWSHLKLKPKLNHIKGGTESYISSGKFNRNNLHLIDFIHFYFGSEEFPLNDTLTQLNSRLFSQASEEEYNHEEIITLYKAMWKIKNYNEQLDNHCKELFQKNIQDGILPHFFYKSVQTENLEDSALLLFYYLKVHPSVPVPSPGPGSDATAGYNHINDDLFFEPSKHKNITRKLLDILENNDELDILYALWQNNSNSHKWICFCFLLLSEKAKNNKLNSEFTINNWTQIKKELAENWEEFLTNIILNTDLLEKLFEKELTISLSSFYAWLIKRDAGKKSRKFLNKIKNWLENDIDQTVWIEQLKADNSGLLWLVREMKYKDYQLSLGMNFSKALAEYASEIISGKISPSVESRYWKNHFKAIGSPDENKVMRSDVLDTLISAEKPIPEIFYEYFGEEMKDEEVLRDNNKTVQEFFIPAVQNERMVEIEWLANLFKEKPNILTEYKPKYIVPRFKSEVKNKLDKEDLDPSIREKLNVVAQALGVQTSTTKSKKGKKKVAD